MFRSKNKKDNIGIVLCDCNGKLRKRLDFARLSKAMKAIDRIVDIKVCSKFCSFEECSEVIKTLSASGAKRLIIGGCSRENFEIMLEEILRKVAH